MPFDYDHSAMEERRALANGAESARMDAQLEDFRRMMGPGESPSRVPARPPLDPLDPPPIQIETERDKAYKAAYNWHSVAARFGEEKAKWTVGPEPKPTRVAPSSSAGGPPHFQWAAK
jgi:hypothetical protein